MASAKLIAVERKVKTSVGLPCRQIDTYCFISDASYCASNVMGE